MIKNNSQCVQRKTCKKCEFDHTLHLHFSVYCDETAEDEKLQACQSHLHIVTLYEPGGSYGSPHMAYNQAYVSRNSDEPNQLISFGGPGINTSISVMYTEDEYWTNVDGTFGVAYTTSASKHYGNIYTTIFVTCRIQSFDGYSLQKRKIFCS